MPLPLLNNKEMDIFIVEDNVLVLSLYVESFKLKGYTVQTAGDGEEAIEKLTNSEKKPDIVLLDILLPKKNGYEVLEYMKQQTELQNIPVIFLTNIDGEGEKKWLTLGAAGYIIKSEQNPLQTIKHVEDIIKNYKRE